MIFENTEVHDYWHKVWSAKRPYRGHKEPHSAIFGKTGRACKRIKTPLQGDKVFIQNQDPSSKDLQKLNRQDNTLGWQVQPIPCQIHETSRLTVRNRRFIKKYTLRSPYVSSEHEAPRISSKDLPKSQKVSDLTKIGESTLYIPEQRILHDP